ncbi:MAG TPA: ABC transporter permease DevC [Pirellulales bacterium]
MLPWYRRVPLAWANLRHNFRRLLMAALGIGFAVLLFFMQLGFQGALYDSTVQVPLHLNADLVIFNRNKTTITVKNTFSRQRLYVARACPGVAAAYPLYMDNRFSWKSAGQGRSYAIRTLAFDPTQPILAVPEIVSQADKLLLPDTVLFDRLSKSDYGYPQPGDKAQFAGDRVNVVGMFSLGTDFANDGNIVMSDITYVSALFPAAQQAQALEQIDIGLVRLVPGADLRQVEAELGRMLPPDVRVMTKAEFVRYEQKFWKTSTPIGTVFGFGVALGFVVGVIICYQILYADITDHLREFATLKAIGYRPRYFVVLVLQEALLLSILGFVPGLLASEALYGLLGYMTGLLMELGGGRAVEVWVLTVAMCVLSGLLTMRKVLAADPATLLFT